MLYQVRIYSRDLELSLRHYQYRLMTMTIYTVSCMTFVYSNNRYVMWSGDELQFIQLEIIGGMYVMIAINSLLWLVEKM